MYVKIPNKTHKKLSKNTGKFMFCVSATTTTTTNTRKNMYRFSGTKIILFFMKIKKNITNNNFLL